MLRGEVGTVADAAVARPCAYVHRFELLPHRTNAPPADDRIDVPPAAGPPAYTYRTAPPAAGNGTGFATVRVGVRQVSTPVQQCAADGSTGEPGGTPRTPWTTVYRPVPPKTATTRAVDPERPPEPRVACDPGGHR